MIRVEYLKEEALARDSGVVSSVYRAADSPKAPRSKSFSAQHPLAAAPSKRSPREAHLLHEGAAGHPGPRSQSVGGAAIPAPPFPPAALP